MKRIIALLLVLAFSLGLTACSQVSANDLMKGVPAKAVDVLPDMDAGAAAAADFGVRLFKTSMEEGENTLISPLSVLYALAMTTNGAEGETLSQMEQVLGMDVDNMNSYSEALNRVLVHYDKMITDAASKTIINDQGKKVTVVDPEVKQNIQQTLMLQIFLKYDHLAGPPEVR